MSKFYFNYINTALCGEDIYFRNPARKSDITQIETIFQLCHFDIQSSIYSVENYFFLSKFDIVSH